MTAPVRPARLRASPGASPLGRPGHATARTASASHSASSAASSPTSTQRTWSPTTVEGRAGREAPPCSSAAGRPVRVSLIGRLFGLLACARRAGSRRARRRRCARYRGPRRRASVCAGVRARAAPAALPPAPRAHLCSDAELGEAGWVMAEPSPQLATRRELARPLVEARSLTRDAARPEPVDQHAVAIGCCRQARTRA